MVGVRVLPGRCPGSEIGMVGVVRLRGWVRVVAVGLVASLAVSGLPLSLVQAAGPSGASSDTAPELFPFRSERSVGRDVAVSVPVRLPDPPRNVAPVVAAESLVDVGGAAAVPARVGPVELAADPGVKGVSVDGAGSALVSVVDEKVAQAAGLEKVAFSVDPDDVLASSDAMVRLSVDYSSFRDAYGADWAGRLQLVVFEQCWLQAPGSKGCAGPRVVDGFVNDLVGERVYVDVRGSDLLGLARSGVGGFGASRAGLSTGGPGFGLSAGAYSNNGNYATSSLNPSGSWSVGLNSGGFSWSYPVGGLAAPAGAAPTVSVSYSSQSVDGMSADQNTQGGPVGLGWATDDAFIERTFKSCNRDGGAIGDFCFVGFNGTISMAGISGELVAVAGPTAGPGGYSVFTYASESDAGWVVQLYTKTSSAARGGFEDDALDSYWVVNDLAGNQYWFGFGKSEGVLGDAPGTDLHSSWTVPAYSLQAGEPCYGQSPQWCHMTYRWKLDRIVDANGRVTTYHYDVDKNFYGRAGGPANTVPYVLGGRLNRIEYGQLLSTAGDANVETSRIKFDYSYRCSNVADCVTAPTTTTGANFPDIPVDQFCGFNGSSTYCTKYAPTFFDVSKLKWITPQRRVGPAATDWSAPERHELTQDWVDADGSGPDPKHLWLRTISRRELTTNSTSQPIRFDSWTGPFANRVDDNPAAGVTDMRLYRVDGILDDLGRDIRVTYSAPDAGCEGKTSGWNSNTLRCFPRWFSPTSGTAGFASWNRYRVDRVDVQDGLGASATMTTSYDYLEPFEDAVRGGMAWHADMSPYQDASTKSWGDSRGYYRVKEIVGSSSDPNRSVTEHVFYRGMDQDLTSHTPGAAKKNVVVLDKSGAAWTDHDWLQGSELESWSTNATGSVEYAGQLSVFEWSSRSAVSGFSGTAYRVLTDKVKSREQGGFYGLVDFGYDTSHRLVHQVDYGDVNASYVNVNGPATTVHPSGLPDDTCTLTYYTATTAPTAGQAWFPEGLPAATTVVPDTTCADDGSTRVAASYLYYDDQSASPAWATAPKFGNVTQKVDSVGDTTSVVRNSDHTATGSVTTRMEFEPNGFAPTPGWGRVTRGFDAAGQATLSTYSSFAGAAALTTAGNHNVNDVAMTNALGWVTHSVFDLWGRDVQTIDANNRSTRACYDEWSRVVELWLPDAGYTACGTGNPSATYAYVFTNHTVVGNPLSAFGYTVPRWRVQTRQLFATATDPWRPAGATTATYLETDQYVDASGRTVQEHTASPAGGRLVTRTVFNSRGLAINVSSAFTATGNPSDGPINLATASIPIDTAYSYDALGRTTATSLLNSNGTVTVRQTTTSYSGRTTTSNPPINPGGTHQFGATISTVDAHGRLTKVIEPTVAAPGTSPAIVTEYEYTPRGELAAIIDTAGNQTSMTYNWLGQITASSDPNAGATSNRYYLTGQIERTADAKGQVTSFTYDPLGRPLTTRLGSHTSTNLLAEYSYDTTTPAGGGSPTVERGVVATATSYWQPDVASTTTAPLLVATSNATDSLGRLTTSTLQLQPSTDPNAPNYNRVTTADDPLFAPYTFSSTFTRTNTTHQQVLPGVAGRFTAETLTSTYTSLGLATALLTDDTAITGGKWVADTTYDAYGRITGRNIRGANGYGLDRSYTYSTSDGSLTTLTATIAGGLEAGSKIQNDNYTYDHAGNPTSVLHQPDIGGTERECFYFDARARLTRSYTTAGTACAADATTAAATTPTGPTPYNEGDTYDDLTRFATHNGRTYQYTNPTGTGAPTDPTCAQPAPRPHATRAITGGTPTTEWYWYDCNGAVTQKVENPTSPTPTTWTYGWNAQQQLQTVQQAGQGVSTNLYAAGGNRILRHDPDGTRTLYLGAIEISQNGNNGCTATKFYPSAQQSFDTTATRTTTLTAANSQGSIAATINNTGATTTTRYLPYGDIRHGQPANGKAFLGQTKDPAQNLDYLNARSVATGTGQFLSVDPIFHPTRPASLSPYLYAQGNPISQSDPSGLDPGWSQDTNPCNDNGYYACRAGGVSASHIVGPGDRQCRETRYLTLGCTAPGHTSHVTPRAPAKPSTKSDGFSTGDVLDGLVDGALNALCFWCVLGSAWDLISDPGQVVDLVESILEFDVDVILEVLGFHDCGSRGYDYCIAYKIGEIIVGSGLAAVATKLDILKSTKSPLDDPPPTPAPKPVATKVVDPAGLGAAGESVSSAATGLPKNTTRIPSASGNAEFRIPDHMSNGGRYIAETKNVGYQHLSSQLLDDAAYVTRGGVPGRVDVVIDTRTVVSRPLLRAHLDPGNPINLVTMNLNG